MHAQNIVSLRMHAQNILCQSDRLEIPHRSAAQLMCSVSEMGTNGTNKLYRLFEKWYQVPARSLLLVVNWSCKF